MRPPRIIYYGATQNGNATVGGWLPFIVDLSPIYNVMRVCGTLYTDYETATYPTRLTAIEAAMYKASQEAADNACGDTVQQVSGCHRCWDENDAKHLKWINGFICCGTCGRKLPQTVDHGPQKRPASIRQIASQQKHLNAGEC